MAKFLFILSKDDNEAATRCFQFARIAHSKGHHVNLFFIDGGVPGRTRTRDLGQKTADRRLSLATTCPIWCSRKWRSESAPPAPGTETWTKPVSSRTCASMAGRT
jgi:hypothetical protein